MMTGTQITMSGAGETPIAKAALSYEIWYRTIGTDAENAL
jgi:hypothetical protein